MVKRLVSIDIADNQMPDIVRDRIAANIADPATVEGAAVASAAIVRVNAPNNGISSATVAIQNAINAAGGRLMFLPPGDYLLDGSLTSSGPVNMMLDPGARIIQSVNAPAIEFTGGGSGTSRGLYAAANAGQNIIECSTSGLVAGDWILVRSPNTFPGSVKGSKIGELQQIRQVDGASQLRTVANLDYSYPITTASVVKFSVIDGVRIVGGQFVNGFGASMKVPMVRLTACVNVTVDTDVRNAGGPGVTLSGCAMFDVTARISGSLNDATNGNFGYGVEAFGATCLGRVNVTMHGGRHAFTTNSGGTTSGVPRQIEVTGIASGLTETAWDTHEEGDRISFIDTLTVGCRNGGLKHRAPNSLIINPTVRNTLGLGVRFTPTASNGVLRGGVVEAKYLSDTSPGTGVSIEGDDVTVTGDPRLVCDDIGVLVLDGADRSRVRSGDIRSGVRGNAATSIGIKYEGTSTGHVLHPVSLANADVGVSRASGVAVTGVGPQHIDLNVLSSPVSQVNWSDVQQNSSYWFSARRLSSGAQNDEIVLRGDVPYGQYKFELFHDTSTSRGIYTVQAARVVDGVIGSYATLGTIDGYAATSGRAVGSVTFEVTDPGVMVFRLLMASKNASATNYFGSVSRAVLVRS